MDMGVKYIFPSGQVLVVENNNLELRLGKIGQDNSPGGDLTKTSRSVDSLTILKTKQSKRLHFYLSRYSHKV